MITGQSRRPGLISLTKAGTNANAQPRGSTEAISLSKQHQTNAERSRPTESATFPPVAFCLLGLDA